MAKAAMTEMERQIEEVRREAYAAGYSAAMQAIRDAATPLAPNARTTAAVSSSRRRGRAEALTRTAQPSRRRPAAIGATRRLAPRQQRGANALIIEEILKAMAPSPVRPAEIRKALQDNGVTISFASVRNALGQLEARNAAEQVGDSKMWRYRGGAG